ncbi:hypothetical protein EVAR_61739_1 [Eumeta japonica]|uniref:Reverse transcriptase domain-containing protein n=1 Tax=Eumeta variegata TaxID=151549 RepID=A0A4C1YLF5_EUMVA|nr:hypothetical protein EVAR_61739_1 [Eumeta japonica]
MVRGYLRDWEVFVDDVVLMFSGQSASSIAEKANHAIAHVHCWGVTNKLRFAPSKTNSSVLTKKLKYDDPVVHMNGEQINSNSAPIFYRIRHTSRILFFTPVRVDVRYVDGGLKCTVSIAEAASARNVSSNIFAFTAYCRGFSDF